ncbi:MAG TPA: M48 family metallopeptidase [Chitinophagaceae bacterium]|nr:M48 family metallopeptidase [Chitinophagaceae bacterium]
MKSYFGSFTSTGLGPVECTVLVFDKNLSIGYKQHDGSNAMPGWQLLDVDVQFDVASQVTRLRNNKIPGELLIEGNEAAEFVKSMKVELQKPWHQKSSGREWIRNSFLFLGILGLLFLLYLLIVPWLSSKLASRVSVKTEQQLGEAVYNAMGLASQEDSAATVILNEFFHAMDIPTTYAIKISVVNDNTVNAFALPGGRIVVYKALLHQVKTYPELAALLSHEFTHINNKHSTKSIFRRLGSKVFLGLLFGRFGTVTSIVVDHADNLKNLRYSRRLEKEADMEGLSILTQRKIDPAGFTSLFEHLKASAPGTVLPEFLGSHPDIEKRINYLKEASKNSAVAENLELKAIFERLK